MRETPERQHVVSAALDTLPVSVAIVDTDGDILWTNAAWRSFGAEAEADPDKSGTGVNYFDAVDESDEYATEAVEGLDAVLTGEREEFSFEYPCHSPDEKRWFLMWAAGFASAGERYGVVAHFDITERKLAEEGVSETAAEVSRQRDHLALLNQIVRHDIRNDVQLVLTHAELLDDAVPEDERGHLDRVLRQSRHIIELTEAVRDLAEVIVGESEPTLTPVNLGSVLQTEADKVRSSYATAGTEPRITGLADVPMDVEVLANEMLSSVVGNLLSNAVIHNDSDEPHVDVSLDTDGDRAVVTIADNGPGIPEAERPSVFGRGEMSIDSPGSGLGLYLVDKLVDLYDGDVWITDSDLGGAAFHVALQFAE